MCTPYTGVLDEKLNKQIKEQTVIILGEIHKLKEFTEDKFRDQVISEFEMCLMEATAFLSAIYQKLDFVTSFKVVEINDEVAARIDDTTKILESEENIANIKLFIARRCKPELTNCRSDALKG